MKKVLLIITIFAFLILSSSYALAQENCTEKEKTCCKNEQCIGIACQIGSYSVFKGCDENCKPIGSCVINETTQCYSSSDCISGYVCKEGKCTEALPTCTDSDGGKDYYVKGEVADTMISGPAYDFCTDNVALRETFCGTDNIGYPQIYNCPNGCSDGACIKGEQVKEQVTCLFVNSKTEQKCYLAEYNNKFFCSGIESCTIDVAGTKGEKLTWKSTCGGYAYTTINGENENATKYAKFSCSETVSCASQLCTDGSYTQCSKDKNGYCACSTCPSIIIKPVCGNRICESGEGTICTTVANVCEAGKECKATESKCYTVCPQDCSNLQGIYAKLGEKFKLQVNQPVKIADYKDMKIIFRDLLTQKCAAAVTSSKEVINAEQKITGNTVASATASSTGGGGGSSVSIIKCPAIGPMAQLEINMPNEDGKKILTLKLNEAKNVYGVSVNFLDYDYASKTGVFAVNNEVASCPENCKCDNEGNILECKKESICKNNTILCPDGTCSDKCKEVSNEKCDYGCLYNNKCLPIGTRVKGMYCTIDGTTSNQLKSDSVCENNFECESNVCVNSKCVSGSFIEKILSWFSKLFGKD